MKSLSCLVLLLFGFLLTGCGYERYPVRVHWHLQTAPPSGIPAEKFLTYGLDITPPWPDPGNLVLSLPEAIQADSGATTLFSSHDLAFIIACPKCVQATLFTGPPGSKTVYCDTCGTELFVLPSYPRREVWDIANNERTARLDLNSPSMRGVHLRINLKVEGPRMDFDLTLHNGTDKDLHNLSAEFHYNLADMTGSFIPDLGSFPTLVNQALIIVADSSKRRKVLISWQPGEPMSLLANPSDSTVQVYLHLGDLPAGKSVHASGLILFSEGPTEKLLQEALKPTK